MLLIIISIALLHNRINHIKMSLLLHANVGGTGIADAMLVPIQTMKFYQCISGGDPNTYMGERTPTHSKVFARETVQLQLTGL
jgi:hypothetical protein